MDQKRQQFLSNFICPLCESNQPDNDCPFGHLSESELYLQTIAMSINPDWGRLKPLPAYCCASYLTFACSKREYSFECGAHSSTEILTRCEDGFHVELRKMDDLHMIAQKMAKVLFGASEITDSKLVGLVPVCNPTEVLKPLQSNSISKGQKRPRHELIKNDEKDDDDEHSCAICLDQLKTHQIGHLDNCSHVFCAKCIHTWQNQGTNEDCPVCRKQITKILVWPKLLQTQEEKKQLFDLISGGVPSDDRVDRAMSYGTPTTLTTSKGKTMRALQMNPESMKVFLKKPKPNWNCYVMTELAVERSERVPSVGSETTAARTNNENTVSRVQNIVAAHRLMTQHSNIYQSLQMASASNAGPNNAATNNAATINAATNPTATNNAPPNINSQNTHSNFSQVPNRDWPVTGPNTNATINAATNPTSTNNAPPNINIQNTHSNISQVPNRDCPVTGPNTNATTNAATNPTSTNNAPLNINIQNTHSNISQVPYRGWPGTGPNNGRAQINTRYVYADLIDSSGARLPVRMAVPPPGQLTVTNAATYNSAINNVATSLNSNTNNVLSVNSNTNNNAVIVNSNANNASTNNSPSQHREIINVEDSDDDEILIDEILIGQSSN